MAPFRIGIDLGGTKIEAIALDAGGSERARIRADTPRDYDGTVLDTRIRVDYQITDRFGLGLAYNWQKLNVGVEDTNAKGDFNLTTNGVELSAVLRF